MNGSRNKVILFVLLFFSLKVLAQDESKWAVGAKLPLFTCHPGGGTIPSIQKRKLDPNAYLVFTPGLGLSIERYILLDLISVKVNGAYFQDCASLTSGYLQLGIYFVAVQKPKWSINFGVGPTFILRTNWNRFKDLGYEDEGFYHNTKDWQYKWIWYGTELNFYYKIRPNLEFNYAFVPGFPSVLFNSVGLRYSLR